MPEKLVLFDRTNVGSPSRGEPEGADVLGGAPVFTTWTVDVEGEGSVVSGIWEASPGRWKTSKPDAWEFCHVIEGHVEIEETGMPPVVLKGGDSFIMKPGFAGIWNVVETTRKHFVWRKV